jgi:hypothetical protein
MESLRRSLSIVENNQEICQSALFHEFEVVRLRDSDTRVKDESHLCTCMILLATDSSVD